jgi:hypothetical protein
MLYGPVPALFCLFGSSTLVLYTMFVLSLYLSMSSYLMSSYLMSSYLMSSYLMSSYLIVQCVNNYSPKAR